jgi:hypothetical protein
VPVILVGFSQIGAIGSVDEVGRTDYGLSAKVTRIGVKGINVLAFSDRVRDTAIYIQTARSRLLEYDIDQAMPAASSEDCIVVQGKVELPAGRRVVLSGETWKGADVPGDAASEVAIVKSCEPSGANTMLVFTRAVNTVFRSKKLVQPGEVITITLTSQKDPNMARNSYQFRHVNGEIRAKAVKKF